MWIRISGFRGKVELNGGPVSLTWDELAGDAFKDMAISATPCGRSLMAHISICALFLECFLYLARGPFC